MKNLTDCEILIIDSSNAGSKMLQGHLAKLGLSKIKAADSASEGKKQLKEGAFGLVICAFQLDSGDALRLFKEVKEENILKENTSFLVVANDRSEETFISVATSGITNILFKPYQMADLEKKLKLAWE